MTTDELSCRDLVELVTEYLEGALNAAERARFERHLAACDPCPIYLEQMRQTVRALGRLTEDSIPTAAQEQLLRTFRGWNRRA